MVIADLYNIADPGEPLLGRAYLSAAPFPGDVVNNRKGDFRVISRTFLDLGGPHEKPDNRLSVLLKVRPA